MAKRIFKIISIVFILMCIGFYGYRLVHYYNIYSKNSNWEEVEQTPLHKKIVNNSYLNKDLNKKDNGYVYNYKNDKNYIKYSGSLWRILDISEEGNIRVISMNNAVVLSNADSFENSNISKYLNDSNSAIYRNLESPDSFVEKTSVCLDKIESIDNITCEEKKEFLIGIPSLYDYSISGGIEGYMNSGKNYWLSNMLDTAQYYISDTGEVKKTSVTHQYEIKPIITLSNEISYSEGNGSLESPYIVGEKEIDVLNQKHIYEYVSFNDLTWMIIDQDEIGTKVVLNGVLEKKSTFNKKKNTYKDSLIYDYLNIDFYNSIENKDKILKGKWYTGYYTSNDNYDYDTIYKDSVESYVGLLNMNDISLLEYENVYTLTPSDSKTDVVYTIASDKTIYPDQVKKTKNVRPVLYLDPNSKIVSGDGSLESPYVME